jgi:hypothetical protein
MQLLRVLPLVLSVSSFACAKKDTSTPTTPPSDAAATGSHDHDHDHDHGGEPAHKHEFQAGVKSYHDVLSPLWHAPKDDARVTNTCAAAADLAAKAATIESEPAPAGADAAAWKTRAALLSATTKALETSCAGDRKDFDAAFTTAHEAFHKLIELAGEHHE